MNESLDIVYESSPQPHLIHSTPESGCFEWATQYYGNIIACAVWAKSKEEAIEISKKKCQEMFKNKNEPE